MRGAAPALIVLLLAAPATTAVPLLGSPAVYLPHPMIVIEGDHGFRQPGSGVVSGDGTEANPYIISGWAILSISTTVAPAAITLRDTTAHVIIQDNLVNRAEAGPYNIFAQGIALDSTSNVVIHSNHLGPGLDSGILGHASHKITVTQNTILSALTPISFANGDRIHVDGNSVSCPRNVSGHGGIVFASVTAAVVEHNHVSCRQGPGIDIDRSEQVEVLGNQLTDTAHSIKIERTRDVAVAENIIEGGWGSAMWISTTGSTTLHANLIRDSTSGIYLGVDEFGTGPIFVTDNIISGTSNTFKTNGYPSPYHPEWSGNVADGKPILLYKNLHGAILDGSGFDPAYVLLADSSNVTLTNWTISSHVETPLNLINVRDSVVRDSHFHDGGGVKLAFGGGNTVRDNHFERVSNGAIRVGSGATTIQGNAITGPNIGIEFRWLAVGSAGREPANGAGSTVTGNTVDTEGSPLYIHETAGVHAHNNTFEGTRVSLISAPDAMLRHNNLAAGYVRALQSKWPGSGFAADAQANWWGSPDGPGQHDIPGHHDVTIDDAHWLTAPVTFS